MDEAKSPGKGMKWSSLDIFLFSNGQKYSPPRKYHLQADELNWWDTTLNYLARSQYGSMHKVIDLYTIDGKKLSGPLQLNDGGAYVAVEPPDMFLQTGYTEYLIKASRSWEKSQEKRSGENNESTMASGLENFILTRLPLKDGSAKERDPDKPEINSMPKNKGFQNNPQQNSILRKVNGNTTKLPVSKKTPVGKKDAPENNFKAFSNKSLLARKQTTKTPNSIKIPKTENKPNNYEIGNCTLLPPQVACTAENIRLCDDIALAQNKEASAAPGNTNTTEKELIYIEFHNDQTKMINTIKEENKPATDIAKSIIDEEIRKEPIKIRVPSEYNNNKNVNVNITTETLPVSSNNCNSGKHNVENFVYLINKGDIVDFKFKIEVTDEPNMVDVDINRSNLNLIQGYSLNQYVQNKDLSILIIHCACSQHQKECVDTTTPSVFNDLDYLVLNPKDKAKEHLCRCQCRECTLKNADDTADSLTAQSNKVNMEPKNNQHVNPRLNSDVIEKNESGHRGTSFEVIQRTDILLTETHSMKLLPSYVAQVSESNQKNSEVLKSIATKDDFTQTDWNNIVLVANLHDDNGYSFHMPSLEVLKRYNLL